MPNLVQKGPDAFGFGFGVFEAQLFTNTQSVTSRTLETLDKLFQAPEEARFAGAYDAPKLI